MLTAKQLHNFHRKINLNGPTPDQSKPFYAGLDQCHEWTASIDRGGYGMFAIGTKKLDRAHRVSWKIHVGQIPQKKFILHKCDNRKCVNVNHLFLGDHQTNSDDMLSKGRGNKATGDRNGSRTQPEKLRRGPRPEVANPGESNGEAKLTNDQVIEIRKMYATGEFTQKKLAQQFKIGTSQMNRILRNLSWKSIL